jgi:HK97 family phage major capsid protein
MTPNRSAILAEVDQILHKSSITREDTARCENLLALADAIETPGRDDFRRAITNRRAAELGRPHEVIAAPDAKFSAYLRRGKSALTLEDQNKFGIGTERQLPNIRSAQAVGTGSTGGYLVPQSFSDRFEVMLEQTDELFKLATLWETETGSTSSFPILDDVSNSAAIVSENSASTELDLTFTRMAFGLTPMWRTGYVVASMELVSDSKFNLESLVAGAFGVRMARGIGATFMATLIAAAGTGVTTASPTAITADELWSLVASLDAAFAANASFLMLRSTYAALMKLKGSTSGDYMFRPTFDSAGRPTLCGNFPVYFSPSAGPMTAGQTAVLLGDMSRFVRRQVRDSLSVKVLVEKFALLAQVGYLGFLRADGLLAVGSGPVPVQGLVMHA